MSAYWRFAWFYTCYFAYFGAYTPYWTLYLKGLGFSAAAIGTLLAATQAIKLVAPTLWATYADRRRARIPIVRGLSSVAIVCFLPIVFDPPWPILVGCMMLMGVFWSAALPLMEANTLAYLGPEQHRYSRIRVWGSLGFAAVTAAVGWMMERFGSTALPFIALGFLLAVRLTVSGVPEAPYPPRVAGRQRLRDAVSDRRNLFFLLGCFLVCAAHGAYYGFFTLFVVEHGYSETQAGLLWSFAVLAEIVFFWLAPRWLPRHSASTLWLISLAVTAARFAVTGWAVDSAPVLWAVQALHAITFGLYHSAAMSLLREGFPEAMQSRAQAVYNSVFGAGSAIGMLLAGVAWEARGGVFVFEGAAALGLAGLLVGVWRQRRGAG